MYKNINFVLWTILATTVSRCPYTYCNFGHREVSPGRFVLPSVQDDQCVYSYSQNVTGPACGSRDDGYTYTIQEQLADIMV